MSMEAVARRSHGLMQHGAIFQIDASTNQAKATPNGGFPADFFSDPSRMPPPTAGDQEGGEDDPDSNTQKARSSTTIDAEFEAFERALNKTRPPPTAMQDIYSRATVAAEPELLDIETLQADGFPPDATPEGAASKSEVSRPVGGEPGEPEEETEAQKAKRKQQDEKELIMDRILDEERAQEAAEEKVAALKARFEAIKKQREARKLAAAGKK